MTTQHMPNMLDGEFTIKQEIKNKLFAFMHKKIYLFVTSNLEYTESSIDKCIRPAR